MTKETTHVMHHSLTEEEAIVYMAEGWDTSKPVTDEQWENSYYRKAFEKVRQGKWTWNWAAAIFGGYWFVDHRFYLMAGVIALFHLIAGLHVFFGGYALSIHIILTILPMLLCGAYGNKVLFSRLNCMLSKRMDGDLQKSRAPAFVTNYYMVTLYLAILLILELPRTLSAPSSLPNFFHHINMLQCMCMVVPSSFLLLTVALLTLCLSVFHAFI